MTAVYFLAIFAALVALWAFWRYLSAQDWFDGCGCPACRDDWPDRLPLTAVHPESSLVQMASFHGKAAKSAEAFRRGPRDGGRAA